MRKLSESVWGSIRKKSMGQEDRAEDGLEKFCEKLQSMYETPNSKGRITIQDDKICVYIFKNKLNMYTTLWIENVEKDRDYVTLAGTNPAKYRFSPSTMPLKVHTLGIYAVIKNKFKVEETESDGLEHWLHLKISHKDGSIFTNNDCIGLIDLILNSIEDGKGIFPLLSKNVNESVWGSIRKKSLGQETRIEDGVNKMSKDRFFEYLVKNYEYVGPRPEKYSIKKDIRSDYNTVIWIPIYQYKDYSEPYYIRFDYHIKGKTINDRSRDKIDTENSIMLQYESWMKPEPALIEKLAENEDFTIEEIMEYDEEMDKSDIKYLSISPYPSSGKEINQQFFIDIIDYILDEMDGNMTPVLKKKSSINESVWGSIRKKSLGLETRIEDDINNLDSEGLTDYLKKHYKPLNSFAIITNAGNIISVPIIREHTNSCIMFSCETKSVIMTNDIMDQVQGLLRVMENNFSIKTSEGEDGNGEYKVYTILPKDGSEVTNKFFIEVIDFLLYHIPGHLYKKSIMKIDDKS